MADLSSSLNAMGGLNLDPSLWSGAAMPSADIASGATSSLFSSPTSVSPNWWNAGLPLTSSLASIAGGFVNQQASQSGLQAVLNQLNQINPMLSNYLSTTQAAYQPFLSTGTQAAQALQAPQTAFQTSPGFQFGLQTALDQINKQAAARGNYFAPSTMQSIAQTAQGMGLEEYNNWFNQMLQAAGLGLSGAGGISDAGQFTAGQLANLGRQQASVAGQQAAGSSSGLSGMISSLPSLISAGAKIASMF